MKIIDKKRFAKAALDKNIKAFSNIYEIFQPQFNVNISSQKGLNSFVVYQKSWNSNQIFGFFRHFFRKKGFGLTKVN